MLGILHTVKMRERPQAAVRNCSRLEQPLQQLPKEIQKEKSPALPGF